MAMPRLVAFFAILMLGTGASAATVDVVARDAAGRPVADAVVTVEVAHAPAGPVRFPWPNIIRQQNLSFQPHVLIVPVGAAVTFPNMDKVRHHVYSFSKPKKFELKLYGQEEARTVTFDKPGVIALGCNIHDQMSGFIVAVSTPYAAKTDAAGHVSIPGVPAGPATLKLWSPLVRAPNNLVAQSVSVGAAGLQTVVAVR
jgi:plastocyanin